MLLKIFSLSNRISLILFISVVLLWFGINTKDALSQSPAPSNIEFCLSEGGTPLKKGDTNCDAQFTGSYGSSQYLATDGKFYGVCRSAQITPVGYILRTPSVVNSVATCPAVSGMDFVLLNPNIFNSLVSTPTSSSISATPGVNPEVDVCFNSLGTPVKESATNCKGKSTFNTAFYTLSDNKFYGVCRSVAKINNDYIALVPLLDGPGKVNCTDGTTTKYLLIPASTFSSLAPTTSTNRNSSNQNNNSQPKNNTSNTRSSINNKVSTSGDCEGLVKLGPLCLPQNPFAVSKPGSIAGSSSLGDLAPKVINFLLWLSGIIAVVMSIFGGYQVMTAGGNTDQAKTGRKTLINAIFGLIIVVFSYAIVTMITNFITKAER